MLLGAAFELEPPGRAWSCITGIQRFGEALVLKVIVTPFLIPNRREQR